MVRGLPVSQLADRIGLADAPLVIDLRDEAEVLRSGRAPLGAIQRPLLGIEAGLAEWSDRRVVFLCADGHARSPLACQRARQRGVNAAYVDGGYVAWSRAGLPSMRWRAPLSRQRSRWVTAEGPDLERLAVHWAIRRFLDPFAWISYVAEDEVPRVSRRTGATPFDVAGARYARRGTQSTLAVLTQAFDLRFADARAEPSAVLAAALRLRAELRQHGAGASTTPSVAEALALFDAVYAARGPHDAARRPALQTP